MFKAGFGLVSPSRPNYERTTMGTVRMVGNAREQWAGTLLVTPKPNSANYSGNSENGWEHLGTVGGNTFGNTPDYTNYANNAKYSSVVRVIRVVRSLQL